MSRTYNPEKVALVVGGSLLKSWNSIKITRDEPKWNFTTGTRGESTRTKNLNSMGTIEITVPQSSADNDVLSAYAISDAAIPCMVKDNSGSSIATMPKGTVVQLPEMTMSKEPTDRVWQIKGDLVDPMVVGSNSED